MDWWTEHDRKLQTILSLENFTFTLCRIYWTWTILRSSCWTKCPDLIGTSVRNYYMCILLDFLSATKRLTSLSGVKWAELIYSFFSGHWHKRRGLYQRIQQGVCCFKTEPAKFLCSALSVSTLLYRDNFLNQRPHQRQEKHKCNFIHVNSSIEFLLTATCVFQTFIRKSWKFNFVFQLWECWRNTWQNSKLMSLHTIYTCRIVSCRMTTGRCTIPFI